MRVAKEEKILFLATLTTELLLVQLPRKFKVC